MIEIRCPRCNYSRRIPPQNIPQGARWVRCPQCGNRFEYEPKGLETEAEEKRGIPWERRLQLGLWISIKQTLGSVIFSPKSAFSGMPVRDGLREPLAFGLLVGSIGTMCGLFWEFIIAATGIVEPWWGRFCGSLSLPLLFLALIFLSPLLVTIGLFVVSLFVHLLLLLVRGGTSGFGATFRVMAYSQATRVWCIVPFIGSPIGWIWRTIVQIIGLKEAHKISYGKIAVAFLIPLAFLVVAAVLAVLLFVAKLPSF
jgi:predicted Zn finger-like uncharacterized protein